MPATAGPVIGRSGKASASIQPRRSWLIDARATPTAEAAGRVPGQTSTPLGSVPGLACSWAPALHRVGGNDPNQAAQDSPAPVVRIRSSGPHPGSDRIVVRQITGSLGALTSGLGVKVVEGCIIQLAQACPQPLFRFETDQSS